MSPGSIAKMSLASVRRRLCQRLELPEFQDCFEWSRERVKIRMFFNVYGVVPCWNYSCLATHTGFILRVLFTGSLVRPYYSGYLLGATVLIILSIYMGPVDSQVDHHQAIQSILCCAYITTIIVIFIIPVTWFVCAHATLAGSSDAALAETTVP
jgi:hypothetical protein